MTTPKKARDIADKLDGVYVKDVWQYAVICSAADDLRDLARQVEEFQAKEAEREEIYKAERQARAML